MEGVRDEGREGRRERQREREREAERERGRERRDGCMGGRRYMKENIHVKGQRGGEREKKRDEREMEEGDGGGDMGPWGMDKTRDEESYRSNHGSVHQVPITAWWPDAV